MNLNQRRPASAKVQRFEKANKRLVQEALSNAEAELVVEKLDRGSWNERREFRFVFADGDCSDVLCVAMKGESPDWEFMLDEAMKLSH